MWCGWKDKKNKRHGHMLISDTFGHQQLLLSSTLNDDDSLQNFKRKALLSNYLFFESIADNLSESSHIIQDVSISEIIIWIFKILCAYI